MKRNRQEHESMEPQKPDLKSPQVLNMDEHGSPEDEALIAQLLHGFDQMERTIRHPEPPALHELEQLVAVQRRKLRKRALLEWILFLLTALVVIGGNMLLAFSSIAVFATIQALVFVVIIASAARFFYKSRKKVKSGRA
ncbi:YxlC family protein [Paenibacillus sp. KQZ6P-2]|uniref:YxlC family protein n=1 Tax=Paenibacillus mangrovi TaxID=2931978 RepID=A0A9X1WR78_9BACL|nr:YxlC family protein [Paenibacillus mangrovi]MCJ8013867.1 YxlC family protein [Paenibacillus mangrovi]